MKAKEVRFGGKKALRLEDSSAAMVITLGAGPRIAAFGPAGGASLLFWDRKSLGRNAWKLMGGHRVWTTRPMADENEETYAPDNGAVEVGQGDGEWHFLGCPNAFGLRRGMRVRAEGGGRWRVTNFVRNESNLLWSGGVWSLTCTDPAGGRTYCIPLGNGGDWDAFAVVVAKAWAGHSSLVADPQLEWNEDTLVARPAGRECKRMIQAPRGLVGLCDRDLGLSFFKRVAYDPAGRYPCNCNIALYIGPDNFMVEMETMGPERMVLPGDEIAVEEQWMLGPYVDPADGKAVLKRYGA